MAKVKLGKLDTTDPRATPEGTLYVDGVDVGTWDVQKDREGFHVSARVVTTAYGAELWVGEECYTLSVWVKDHGTPAAARAALKEQVRAAYLRVTAPDPEPADPEPAGPEPAPEGFVDLHLCNGGDTVMGRDGSPCAEGAQESGACLGMYRFQEAQAARILAGEDPHYTRSARLEAVASLPKPVPAGDLDLEKDRLCMALRKVPAERSVRMEPGELPPGHLFGRWVHAPGGERVGAVSWDGSSWRSIRGRLAGSHRNPWDAAMAILEPEVSQ